jgi:hypothetical protein
MVKITLELSNTNSLVISRFIRYLLSLDQLEGKLESSFMEVASQAQIQKKFQYSLSLA